MHRNRLLRRIAVVVAAAGALAVVSTGSARQAAGPTEVSPPTIAGVAIVGRTVTGSSGTWSGVQPITYTFQWLR